MKTIHILGGGTFNYVRNHLALAAPAFGETAKRLTDLMNWNLSGAMMTKDYQVKLHLTKMANSSSNLVTNDNVSKLIDQLIEDPSTRCIIFNVALTDYIGSIGITESGKYATRLETSFGDITMDLSPSEKIISRIRKERKDIFVVGFKTTNNEDASVQYTKGLHLLKKNSLNLVLANDTVTRNNIIIAPEETKYCDTTNRDEALKLLSKMIVSRIQNTFTRSTIVEGSSIDWNSEIVPENLRTVVNYCIKEGAYKPVLGKTAGHFAVKLDDTTILTSIRKTNYNELDKIGLVKVVSTGINSVIAHGNKPSVGGQSQRQIFSKHQDVDCIVHFHCLPKTDRYIPTADQWPNECGSHECGANTSNHLEKFDLGDGHFVKMVYLDNHGPNIVFNKSVPSQKVINFISDRFDLASKTGGLI